MYIFRFFLATSLPPTPLILMCFAAAVPYRSGLLYSKLERLTVIVQGITTFCTVTALATRHVAPGPFTGDCRKLWRSKNQYRDACCGFVLSDARDCRVRILDPPGALVASIASCGENLVMAGFRPAGFPRRRLDNQPQGVQDKPPSDSINNQSGAAAPPDPRRQPPRFSSAQCGRSVLKIDPLPSKCNSSESISLARIF